MLKTNNTLQRLDLRGNKIDERGGDMIASGLQANTALLELVLGDNDLSVFGSVAMAGWPDCLMIARSPTVFADALVNSPQSKLTSLDLSANGLGGQVQTGPCVDHSMLNAGRAGNR